ncbi:hypothetical protein GQR60_00295 [Labilibaculum sp. A4]|uniref:Lipoprotein n=1 Tax=Labilibaculum euxinus TaxID=2686357 RepID=A0A425YGH0_9BACT|nr:DUF6146 family protein [Labilibaculum euxinus]MDQ1769255.1 DUF6146 family protein [Labilibaculum euxinus]MUP36792.1 hypothetical protein [Labilibaculum euxinus]MVB05997.1 hypothetical protein [Labilibaculum euxinus]MWN74779.1 hypothetical protein [Labilibaculum euxinus]
MKKIIYLFFILSIVYGCSTYSAFKTPVPVQDNENEIAVTDSVEYELLILDPGFESWFTTRNMMATAHTNNYYKNWNQIYVLEWNQQYMLGNPNMDNYIEYDPLEDYGFEINYKLYNYFQFVEEKTGISLVRR